MKKFSDILEFILLVIVCAILILSPYVRSQLKILVFFSIVLWVTLKAVTAAKTGIRGAFFRNPLQMPLAVFFGVCIFTVVFSLNPYHSQKVFLNRFAVYYLCFLLGLDLVILSRRNINWLIGAFLLSGAVLAAGGIKDYLRFHPARLLTAFGNPIPYAMMPLFITYFIPLNFAFFYLTKNTVLRVVSGVNICLLVPCAVWQGSRSAWIAIAVGLLYVGFFRSRRGFFLMIAFLVLIFSFGLSCSEIKLKLKSIPNPSEWSDRTPLFDSALKMFKDHPIKGVGLGMYEQMIKNTRYNLPSNYPNPAHDLYLHPHNIYLELLSETGLMGLLAFLYLFYSYFLAVIQSLRKINHDYQRVVVIGISAVVVSMLVFGVGCSIITVGANETYMFWLLLGMSIALLSVDLNKREFENGGNTGKLG